MINTEDLDASTRSRSVSSSDWRLSDIGARVLSAGVDRLAISGRYLAV